MQNDQTPGMGLPLPHPDNKLQDDVLRLRAALADVDTAYAAMQQAIAGKVSQQDYDAAISQMNGAIANLNTSVTFLSSSRVATVNSKPGPAVTLRPADLQGSAITAGFDAQGRLSTVQRTIDAKTETTAFTRDAKGRIAVATITYDGATRIETYTRDGAGRINGMTT